MILEEGVVVRVADIHSLHHTAQSISTIAWQVKGRGSEPQHYAKGSPVGLPA